MATSAWLAVIAFVVLFVLGWLAQRTQPRRSVELADELPEDGEPSPSDVGLIEIEDAIDLHGFQPKEIPAVVESYLEAAIERGLSEVRLIHGRGKGVQRERVQALLARHPMVEAFGDAPAYQGGWGATVARLRKKQ
jgi:dsDNA-specific endonuclease/ATPase MutS2